MNVPSLLSIYLIILLGISGCDCIYKTKGIVVDETTNVPLDSVTIRMESKKSFSTETGTDGLFYIDVITGLTCGCKGIVFERTGYQRKVVDIDANDSVIVKLRPIDPR